MRTALIVLLVCALVDLVFCVCALVLVWLQYRMMRRAAAAAGEDIPSAAGQFGCLIAAGAGGFALLYGAVWFLVRE